MENYLRLKIVEVMIVFIKILRSKYIPRYVEIKKIHNAVATNNCY